MTAPLPSRPKKRPVTKTVTVPAAFERFCADFNAGRFFEAHEWLEEVWQYERGPIRDLYKGLIQIAAGFVHASRGNRGGAIRLLATGVAYLEPYRETGAMGWDAAAIAAAAEDALRRLHESPPGLDGFDIARRPIMAYDAEALGREAPRWNAWGFDDSGNPLEMEITVAG